MDNIAEAQIFIAVTEGTAEAAMIENHRLFMKMLEPLIELAHPYNEEERNRVMSIVDLNLVNMENAWGKYESIKKDLQVLRKLYNLE